MLFFSRLHFLQKSREQKTFSGSSGQRSGGRLETGGLQRGTFDNGMQFSRKPRRCRDPSGFLRSLIRPHRLCAWLTMQPLFGSRRGSSGDQFRAILFFGTDNVILPFLESIVWPNWKYHRCGNKVPGRRLIWNSPFSNLSRRSLFQFGARRNSYLQYPRTRDVCVAFRLSHFQRPLKYSLPLCLLSHLVQIFNKAFPSRCYH